MKKLFYILAFTYFLIGNIYGQDITRFDVHLNWFNKTINLDQNELSIATFDGGKIIYGQPHYSSFHKNFDVTGNGTISFELSNIKTETIKSIDQTDLIGSSFKVEGKVYQQRSSFKGTIAVFPYRKTNGKLERLISCTVEATLSPLTKTTLRGPERTYTSVLSEGNIYKIRVKESGIYQLTYDQLVELGLDVNNIDARNVAVYANYGGINPEQISQQNPDDLVELSSVFLGESDGKVDKGDKLYFYLQGASRWISNGTEFNYEKNIYDNYNYAFIKIKGSPAKRIKKEESSTPADIASYYDDYQIYEEDLVNLLGYNGGTEGSGKKWYGPKLSDKGILQLGSHFDFSNLLDGQINFETSFISRSSGSSKSTLMVGTETYTSSYSSVKIFSALSLFGREKVVSDQISITENAPIQLSYSAPAGGEGWLDYFKVTSKKNTDLYKGQVHLRNILDKQNTNFGYSIPQISNKQFWNVTDITNTYAINPLNNVVSYTTNGQNNTLIAFDENSLMTPELLGKVENQNVHALTDFDMMIVYYKDFEEAVDKLIDHRTTFSGLNVGKIEVSKLYPEFSSGRLDPSAIRDFAKMLLDRNSDFKYMLLFGDGTYDQRGLLAHLPNHQFIPVYETDESINPIRAFPTDDYYALLSDNEGIGLDGALDIAVGRLPVTTLSEANGVVNKIIEYDTSKDRFGDWKLRSTFVADDEDTNTHLNQSNHIANEVNRDFPMINDQKIFIDAYRQETTPGGQRYPEVEDNINRNIDQGNLTFCYLGHGGPKGWAQERILKVPDIQKWDNMNNQTLIVTATCSFTGYDDPEIKSAGEYVILNPKGGAVGLFTTVRAVYANDNARLTGEVFKNLYTKDENGLPITFGDAIVKAKNANSQDTSGENSRKFSLIGDPSQRIALPRYDIVIDLINGIKVEEFTDTIGALETVKISGMVVNQTGNIVDDFNGILYPTVFDKRSIIETLENDPESDKTKISVLKNIIFKGAASVNNGVFEFSFIVPKDINYEIGKGKISLYATDHYAIDAAGYYNDIIIGESDNIVSDDQGPNIELYINDDTFEDGDIVSPNPNLLAYLTDDFGINVTGSGIGHDLTAELKGPEDKRYILNGFYQATIDDYTSGKVYFPMEGLPEGTYSLTLKAWDINNNSSEKTITFTIQSKSSIFNLKAYPNPFDQNFNVAFSHDLGSINAQTTIELFDTNGRLIGRNKRFGTLRGGTENITFDLESVSFGSNLVEGLYIYKIKLSSESLGISRESKFQKIVKI